MFKPGDRIYNTITGLFGIYEKHDPTNFLHSHLLKIYYKGNSYLPRYRGVSDKTLKNWAHVPSVFKASPLKNVCDDVINVSLDIIDDSNQCDHDFKYYEGLTNTYYYCNKCDIKKSNL